MNKRNNKETGQYYDETRTKQTVERLLQKYADKEQNDDADSEKDGNYISESEYSDDFYDDEQDGDYEYVEVEDDEDIPYKYDEDMEDDDYDSQTTYSQPRRSKKADNKKNGRENTKGHSNKIITIPKILFVLMFMGLIFASFKAVQYDSKRKEAENRYNQLMKTTADEDIQKLKDQIIELTLENENLKSQAQTEPQTEPAQEPQAAEGQPAAQEEAPAQVSSYKVQKNDSIWKIAKKLCIDGNVGSFYQAILDENNMTSDYKLSLGEIIKIPAQ